ncbi:ABC transporter permease [candidate division KSB1 bacterium]|nr:ABC transporter permease [candidate division KSB1 bacterium]
MACTILIVLWVQNELSFDRFHNHSDHIYLVLRGENEEPTAVTSNRLGPALKEEIAEVNNAACIQILPENYKAFLKADNIGFEESISLVDSTFFSLFSFKFLKGNPSTALNDPHSIVITEELEKKYFGEEDAMGKILTCSAFGLTSTVRVNGVLENIPGNSHIQNRLFFAVSWLKSIGLPDSGWNNQSCQTYIQLRNRLRTKDEIKELASRIKACELRHASSQPETLSYSLLPLTKIHLYGSNIKWRQAKGDIKYVQIFMLIAVMILLIASINYMNLSTAQALRRTKEIGVKKTLGANRKSLMLQFFGESLLISFVALIIAVLLVWLFLPEFNRLSGKKLAVRFDEPYFISIAFLVTIVTGLISGCYPALFISSFQPIQILKGKLKLSSSSFITRKGLVVFQFAITIIIIVCTIVVSHQLSFIRTSNIGLDKENLICVRLAGDANSSYRALKNELQKNPAIINIARSSGVSSNLSSTLGVSWPGKSANENKHFKLLHGDFDLASTYKIEMSQGRYYSSRFPTDSTSAYILNQAAVKAMGLTSPLNKDIMVWERKGRIIGVTKDFHFASFHSAIEPLILIIPDRSEENLYFNTMTVRFRSEKPDGIISLIEQTWKEQLAGIPFNYYFFDDFLNAQYGSDQRMGSLFKYFSFISILIACLGLLGLASISAEQRTKEIGIRKVLGASTSNVALILSKEFVVWVLISNIIAWPLAYYFMNKWLQDFAYRIDIGLWIFVISGGIALLIALATVSVQAIKAATANPVKSLKYE